MKTEVSNGEENSSHREYRPEQERRQTRARETSDALCSKPAGDLQLAATRGAVGAASSCPATEKTYQSNRDDRPKQERQATLYAADQPTTGNRRPQGDGDVGAGAAVSCEIGLGFE